MSKAYKLMYAPIQNLEVGFDQFETLCLKPSPAPLKALCRTVVRTYANYSQQKYKVNEFIETSTNTEIFD